VCASTSGTPKSGTLLTGHALVSKNPHFRVSVRL
jgi:hypothetical protein